MNYLRNFTLGAIMTFALNVSAISLAEVDKEIFDAISAKSGVKLHYAKYDPDTSWNEMLHKIRTGEIQATGGATITEERKLWAKFTDAYRAAEEVVFVKADNPMQVTNAEEFVKYVKAHNLKVGVIKAMAHSSATLQNFTDDSANKARITEAIDHDSLVKLLSSGAVDAILIEHEIASGTSLVSNSRVKELHIFTPVQLGFIMTKEGKNAVSDEQVQKLNTAIATLKKDGTIKAILAKSSK